MLAGQCSFWLARKTNQSSNQQRRSCTGVSELRLHQEVRCHSTPRRPVLRGLGHLPNFITGYQPYQESLATRLLWKRKGLVMAPLVLWGFFLELSADWSHFGAFGRVCVLPIIPELQQRLGVALPRLGDFKSLVGPSNLFRNFGA